MKKISKITALLLAFVMSFSMVSCGRRAAAVDGAPNVTVQESESGTKQSVDDGQSKAEAKQTVAETSGKISMTEPEASDSDNETTKGQTVSASEAVSEAVRDTKPAENITKAEKPTGTNVTQPANKDTRPAATTTAAQNSGNSTQTTQPATQPVTQPATKPAETSGSSGSSGGQSSSGIGFHVSGTKLLDANGNEFVMRGINEAHAWYKAQDQTSINAIAATGANCVRIVCGDGDQYARDSVESLKSVIEMCKNNKLVAILEVHDATGKDEVQYLRNAADYWIQVKDALIGNEKYVILNIANEWCGSWNADIWKEGYTEVIPKLRNAGIKNTIMVDAAGWGQYPDCIKLKGKEVAASDPDGNTMFSIHMYEYAGSDSSKIQSNLKGATDNGLCVCVGEFGYKHTGGDVDEEYIMKYCTENKIGYIGWSWKGNSGGVEYLDIAVNWDGSVLSSEWGEKLINGTYGIKATSKLCTVY